MENSNFKSPLKVKFLKSANYLPSPPKQPKNTDIKIENRTKQESKE